MDTIHDLPARQDSAGIAQIAQTVAMLADTLARQRMTVDRTPDALSRSSVARADATAEQRVAAYDLTTPDKPATPTVDEHAVASGAGLEREARAERETATAAAALAEVRESVTVVNAAVSQPSVGAATLNSASATRQPVLVRRSR